MMKCHKLWVTVALHMQQLNIGLSILKLVNSVLKVRGGRPVSVSVPANVKSIHDMIMEDCRISAKSIAIHVRILREWVGAHYPQWLGNEKAGSKVDPQTFDNRIKEETCGVIGGCFGTFCKNLLDKLVNGDEIWINCYDPETKEQSKEWRHSGSPRPKKFQVQRSVQKQMATVFWG